MAEQLALHLSIDHAGPHLVVVHGLGHQRIALRPVIIAALVESLPDRRSDWERFADVAAAIAVAFRFTCPAR